jgi:hypothetical protein
MSRREDGEIPPSNERFEGPAPAGNAAPAGDVSHRVERSGVR